jgi:hypothetical protein
VFEWRNFSLLNTKDDELFLDDLYLLWGLIQGNRSAQCADERDHIYSILGMAATKFTEPSTRRLIIPDYNISTEELFTMVTKLVLEGGKSLDLLSYQRGGREHCGRSGLPSWVGDYAQPLDWNVLCGQPTWAASDAALCHTFTAEMHTVSMSTLTCSGAVFGVVTAVAKVDDALSFQ